LELQLVGGADQNPDTAGLAAPVAVHVFQLSGMARFERANVFALIEREQQTLGADSLASEELVLAPKEHRTIRRELKHGAQFLAVAVLFRDIDHATWRASAPVAANGLSDLTLTTKGVTATLAPSVGP
jgi:type VI secretion system protein VasD